MRHLSPRSHGIFDNMASAVLMTAPLVVMIDAGAGLFVLWMVTDDKAADMPRVIEVTRPHARAATSHA